jgi:neutral ceramidase
MKCLTQGVFVALCCVGFMGCQTSLPSLEIGVAVIDITPKDVVAHDPLHVKALVFRQGDETAALVVCDLINVRAEMTTQARKSAADQTGIPVQNITITASHTHKSRIQRDGIADKIVQAIMAAKVAAVPVRLQTVTSEQYGLSFNRRFLMKDGSVRMNPGYLNPDVVRPMGPIDPEVQFVMIRRAVDNTPMAALTNFSLHLDTVRDHKDLSADYPYFMEESLREDLGADFISVFGTAPCGNINHLDVLGGKQLPTSYIGNTLAATIKSVLPNMVDERSGMGVRSEVLQVPLQDFTPEEINWAHDKQAPPLVEERSFLEGMRRRKLMSLEELREQHGDTMPLAVHVFRLGAETAIVTLPGEVFVELGMALKDASPFANTLVLELANDHPSYVPNKEAFVEGDYEVVNSRLIPGGGEMLVEAAVRMLKELKAEPL